MPTNTSSTTRPPSVQPVATQSVPQAAVDVPKATFNKNAGQPRKIFGVDLRSILTVVGLTAFFIVAMLGVLIALRQRQTAGPVAPNAPESRPAAAEQTSPNCTISFTVAGPSPSPTPSVSPSPSPTPSVSPSPSPSVSPSPSPTYSCNSTCTTDAQCQTVNAGYVCSNDHGNRCRLDSNRGSESCTPQTSTYACNSDCTTNAQCQTVNSNYICSNSKCRLSSNPTATNCQPQVVVQPSPTVGCNETCVTNADCSNNSHICYTTPDGSNRCRLDNYVNSETCTPPTTTVASASPSASSQPQLPAELPETGPREWGQVIMAGIGIVLAGAALLLLL